MYDDVCALVFMILASEVSMLVMAAAEGRERRKWSGRRSASSGTVVESQERRERWTGLNEQ